MADLNEMEPEYDEREHTKPRELPASVLTGPGCLNCQFVREIPDDTETVHLECRRNSPRPTGTTSKQPVACWPVVAPWDWCGDHKAK